MRGNIMKEKNFELWNTEKNRLFIEIVNYDNNGKIIVLKIESDEFSGKGSFYFMENDIRRYIREINKMSIELNGECVLVDTESEFFLKLYFYSNELYIKGTIGDYSCYSLSFDFKIDQTVLKLLKEALEYIL